MPQLSHTTGASCMPRFSPCARQGGCPRQPSVIAHITNTTDEIYRAAGVEPPNPECDDIYISELQVPVTGRALPDSGRAQPVTGRALT
jgi:hypothetical protein